MKHHWKKHRQFTPQPDGQQRWDKTYQFLLQWSQEIKPTQGKNSANNSELPQEVDHENSSICASLHKTSG